MKTITDQLFEMAPSIIKKQPEVRGDLFSMADDGGVECEVGELLYGFLRVLKPELVLETGTYTGISAMYMGQALKDNGPLGEFKDAGKLITVEYETFHKQRAEELWNRTGVDLWIDCILSSSLDYRSERMFDFMFLDSEPNIRYKELVQFYKNLKPGGFIGIHDCPRSLTQGNVNTDHPDLPSWPFGDVPEEMKKLLKDGDLVKFHLPNPRGLVMFYKRHPEDWNP